MAVYVQNMLRWATDAFPAATTENEVTYAFRTIKRGLSALEPRQVSTCSGNGTACYTICGPGYVVCAQLPTCFNPSKGDTCCIDGTYCVAGTYCAEGGFCCPDGDQNCGKRAPTLAGFSEAVFSSTKVVGTISSGTTRGGTSTLSLGPLTTSGAATTTHRTPKPTNTTNPSTHDLSTGAKVGIAVGVSVGALVLIVLGVWGALKRRRDNRNRLPNAEATYFDGKAELPAGSEKVSEKRVEGSGEPLHEKSGQEVPAEMVNSPRYELEGDWHGHEIQDDRAKQ